MTILRNIGKMAVIMPKTSKMTEAWQEDRKRQVRNYDWRRNSELERQDGFSEGSGPLPETLCLRWKLSRLEMNSEILMYEAKSLAYPAVWPARQIIDHIEYIVILLHHRATSGNGWGRDFTVTSSTFLMIRFVWHCATLHQGFQVNDTHVPSTHL